jgi:beta-galactosidase
LIIILLQTNILFIKPIKMNKSKALLIFLTALVIMACYSGCKNERSGIKDRTVSFDQGWRFLKADTSGAEKPEFDDSSWRTIDLPHDWSIEDLPGQNNDSVIGPFSRKSIGKMATGYTVGGTGWYRKTFVIDKSDTGKEAYLQFDGVYMNPDIWVNGKHVGNHPYGYTSFYYDITPYLNPPGEKNIVAVQVKNEGINSRWYSGSGIYRHTWLTIVNPVHVSTWGTYITTPEVSDKNATVEIITNVTNSGKDDAPVTVKVQLLDPSGIIVNTGETESTVTTGNSDDIKQSLDIMNPELWSPENPNLYQARITLLTDNKESDIYTTTFGIRSIHFDAKSGFTLNGKSIKLKGGCFHHDNGPLGAAAIDRAEDRKIELLKKAGFNAIRCSHNPPSPRLLDACDRLGMLVIDEAFDMWEQSKMAMMGQLLGAGGDDKIVVDDYSKFFKEWWQRDIRSMVVRDRNHPSIIMWSIGNEIPEAADSSGLRIAKNLSAEVRKYDLTRAVTEANVDIGAMTGGTGTWDIRAPHLSLLDVVGYNYAFNRYAEDHIKYPERVMVGTESMPPLAFENWSADESFPFVLGDFTWVAMDYLGEAGTGVPRLIEINPSGQGAGNNPMAGMMLFFNFNSWPYFNDFQGDLDLTGTPKVPYYYRHVVWREQPMSMFVHRPIPAGKKELTSPWGFPDELKSWNWEGHEGEKLLVHVYTRSKLVKLELNGKQVGEQDVDDSKSITATFEVPYEPGTLTAHCFDNGKETSSETIKTVGKPSMIRLTADRSTIKADPNDLSYVRVEILDAEGNIVPDAEILVNFKISGSAGIAGVGSGSPSDMSSFQQPQKKTWHGRCLAIIRPNGPAGKITLTAKAEGLKEALTEIVTEN